MAYSESLDYVHSQNDNNLIVSHNLKLYKVKVITDFSLTARDMENSSFRKIEKKG